MISMNPANPVIANKMHEISQIERDDRRPATGLPIGSSVTLASRRERAEVRASRACREAFPGFMDALFRLNVSPAAGLFTPLMVDVARLIAQRTLLMGLPSIELGSLEDLTRLPGRQVEVGFNGELEPERFFAGWARNDLSRAISGWVDAGGRVRSGLVAFGIVGLDHKSVIETGVSPVLILSVKPNVTSWTVPVEAWRASAVEFGALVGRPLACRQRWTPALPELGQEPDLQDALGCAHAARAKPLRGADARGLGEERSGGSVACCDVAPGRSLVATVPACRRGVADARPTDVAGREASGVRGCSDGQNGDEPMNAGVFRSSERPLSLSRVKQSKELKFNKLKGWMDYGIEAKKEALYRLEGQVSEGVARECLNVILGDDVAFYDARKWINAQRTQPGKVQAALRLLIEDMEAGRCRHAGGLGHHYGATKGITSQTGQPWRTAAGKF